MMRDLPTYITDNFPMEKLQCQYKGICGYYIENDCAFDIACPIRWKLRDFLDDTVVVENLNMQIEEIISNQNN